MFELNQLHQLRTVAACGTLSGAAEKLHLSQPALSRSMQHLEEELGVPLFVRQKNKIEFNATGKLAVKYAKRILDEARKMKDGLQEYDRAQHTFFVGSCAPAPLWQAIPTLTTYCQSLTITSEIRNPDYLLEKFHAGGYRVIFLPYAVDEPGIFCCRCGEEHLYFSLPPTHPLASQKTLHLADLNGETMLLRSQLGFWRPIVDTALPDTKFLVQEDTAFLELVKFSVLPSFTSDLAMQREGVPAGRVIIPIADDAANVTYYGCCHAKERAVIHSLFPKK